jgi:hypothetical protein
MKFDNLVKSRNSIEFVIPAKAGIQLFQDVLDPGFRRGDAPRDFLRLHQILKTQVLADKGRKNLWVRNLKNLRLSTSGKKIS